MFQFKSLIAGFFLLSFYCMSFAQNPVDYELRKQTYVANSLIAPGGSKLVLQAYQGVPLDATALTNKLNNISTGETSDFDIIELVRILFLTNGQYDAQILPVLNAVPFWINNEDTVRNYWSENHMIMWMSSDWLLHEKYGKPIDAALEARLKHYLDLKINYNYYEFFSSVYGPYSFSGLVNLADFAQDTVIKNRATQAVQLLLKNFLLIANNKGVYYPAAGRNYVGKYETPYGQNHNNLIYLLTGMGNAPGNPSAAGPFLASSTIDVNDVINFWSPTVDTTVHIGHTLQQGFVLNSGMTAVDKTVFQWSSGAYFHPDVVLETAQLLNDSNLWRQVDFSTFLPFQNFSPTALLNFSNDLNVISKSSVICGQDVVVYKHHAIGLTTVKDFWKGKVGFQQWPCVATVGTAAVYTASGQVHADWNDRTETCLNTHLPYVAQNKNLALLMYRPENTPLIIGAEYQYKEVALHFTDSDFDEVVENGLWLFGRQQQNYVAVRRPSIGTLNGIRYCPNPSRQSWVLFLGDSVLYNNFTNFQDIVNQSVFTEDYYFDSQSSQNIYYAQIILGGDTIDYAWGRDTLATGVEENFATGGFSIYPNPANDFIRVTKDAPGNYVAELYSMNGQLVYNYSGNAQTLQIPVSSFSSGLYALRIVGDDKKIISRKIMVE